MAHDVFISYAADDKATADGVCVTLEARRIRCWIAPRDVLPGMDYAEALIEAIGESRVMVLVFSARSNISNHVRREVEEAASRGIPILPFRIEDVSPSPSLKYYIGAVHWLDALTPPLEKHLEHLAGTVKLLLSRTGAAPRVGEELEAPPAARAAVGVVEEERHVEAPERELPTPPAPGPALATAPFGLRAGAYLLDLLFALIATSIIAALAGIPAMVNPCQDPENVCVQDAGWITAIWLVLPCYLWACNSFGRSPGKRLLGLAVIRNPRREVGAVSVQEAKLLRPGWGLGLARTVVSLAGLSAWGLGYLWALWHKEHKTWHDIVTDTLVVQLK
jgi:uncharacterized RDD family membrane protein YckC